MIKSRNMKWAGHVADRDRETSNAYKTLAGNPEGKRPLARCSSRWEDIKMDLKEIRWQGVDWIHPGQDRGQCWDFVQR
jgi:hypothetical protein